eukprot:m.175804 g.175804  ORF g.175804 m.175804 type:complete len:713 (-) comp31831_c0_seq2:101-2239(-)
MSGFGVIVLVLGLASSNEDKLQMALTPPLGFNTWNHFGCTGISADVLLDTADQFVKLELDKAGYEYINSDDCWMQATRGDGGAGPQIPQPDKFPNGMRVVADAIHSKGLKLGLYTARANNTCGKYAGSCEHEQVDITQWANWTVDYMKDDSCGTCRPEGTIADYKAMQDAIHTVGRPILLTIEGGPDITKVYTGCCGNARRVGHDIGPEWLSMITLVDTGSGLWPYAHNGSLGTAGGFWNDLDMLELGNGVFDADQSPFFAAQARTHYSLWCVMKAVMLLGCDLTKVGPETLAIIKNTNAISINQDPWGRQGRRVATSTPTNTSLDENDHAVAIMKPCDTTSDLQQWRFFSAPAIPALYIAPCNLTDEAQRFNLSGSHLMSVSTGTCVDQNQDPNTPFMSKLKPCVAGKASQVATLDNQTGHFHVGGDNVCLDCFNNQGPNVFTGGCKAPGDLDDNQRFYPYTGGAGMFKSMLSQKIGVDTCLTVRSPPEGDLMYTVDKAGQAWCLGVRGPQSTFNAVPCDPTNNPLLGLSFGWAPTSTGKSSYSLVSSTHGYDGGNLKLGYSNDFGESGPVPHSRWVQSGGNTFTLDLSATSTSIESTDTTNIIDDDNVGNVTKGGRFCLELNSASSLEVWAGLLSGPKWAVALVNRSPSTDTISVDFATQLPELKRMGLERVAQYTAYDVWHDVHHEASSTFTTTVAAHDTVLLIVSPVV